MRASKRLDFYRIPRLFDNAHRAYWLYYRARPRLAVWRYGKHSPQAQAITPWPWRGARG